MLQGNVSYFKMHPLHSMFQGYIKGHYNHCSLNTFYPVEANCRRERRYCFFTYNGSYTMPRQAQRQQVEHIQPFQQHVRDSLPQTKQRNFYSKARSSPRFKFTKHFPLFLGLSTQWISLLPKGGGLIQVDIGGHPPVPTGSSC